MNSDEISTLATKLVLTAFSIWGGVAGVTGAQAQTLAAGAGIVASIGFGVYQNWNKRKVPETAVVTSLAPTVATAVALSAPTVAKAKI